MANNAKVIIVFLAMLMVQKSYFSLIDKLNFDNAKNVYNLSSDPLFESSM